jgi:hypothetical protein
MSSDEEAERQQQQRKQLQEQPLTDAPLMIRHIGCLILAPQAHTVELTNRVQKKSPADA